MTYLDLINDFWERNLSMVQPLSGNEVAFYFYLLKECNSTGWVNPFTLPTRKIVLDLGFRKDLITSVRESLHQKGFIKYTKGDRKISLPKYGILDRYKRLVEIAYQTSYQSTYQTSYQYAEEKEKEKEKVPPHPLIKEKEKEKEESSKTKNNIVQPSFFEEDIYSFDKFWNLYDKKVGRDKAIKLYVALSNKDKEAIFKHVPRYKLSQPDKKYRKDPQTYLRNRSWEDEIIQSTDDTRLLDNTTEKFKKGFSWR